MVRRVPRLRLAAIAATLLLPAAPASATPFWAGWFGQDRPVIYRPVVTPKTYYFAPAGTAQVLPHPHHRHGHPHRHPHRHRPQH